MADMEIVPLSRLAINHLFLAQFEPFRAIILTLHRHDPSLALSILHAVIFHASSRLASTILWSASCSSPSFLSWLCSLLLIELHAACPDTESIDFQNRTLACLNPESLRLRSEFLLHLHTIKFKILKRSDFNPDEDIFDRSVPKKEFEGFTVFDRIEDIGFKRLRDDIDSVCGTEGDGELSGRNEIVMVFDENDLFWLRRAVLEHRVADVFDALCLNIKRQVKFYGSFESELDITVANRGKQRSDEDFNDLILILSNVQAAHLGAIARSVKVGDLVGAFSHIRFLHLDYGLPETEYRTILQDVVKEVLSGKDEYGEAWCALQKKLLTIYMEALSSNSMLLVHMIQAIQDELFRKGIKEHRALSTNQIPPPLQRLLNYINARAVADSSEKVLPTKLIIRSCLKDLYHYARVAGLQLLECVIGTAMSAVRREDLQGAENVLLPFPRLRSLVAVMGWDLLSGKTPVRRTLMQLLWTIKSNVISLEESTLDGNTFDDVSCLDYLCDSLCYHLDVACFVACVNSGKSWSSKSSLSFCGRGQHAIPDVSQSDPFVENFVLERLSVQSPLRVLFDVVPSISFNDAIELINMQPLAPTNIWKRKQDIELMHMRYAIESTVYALEAIGRSVFDDASDRQLGLCHLKDLQKHMEAVINVPRKVFLVNMIISLLHIDDISLSYNFMPSENWSEIASIHSGEHSVTTIDDSVNKLVVSFIWLLLQILHDNLPLALIEHENAFSPLIGASGRLALEWRITTANKFIEDWKWRLSMLQRILPLSERQWKLKETLTVLHAAPSKFLNLCMQREKYDVGEEAVNRFSLSQEDKATLELAEWVDVAFKNTSVENVVRHTADGTSPLHSIDFASLCSQIGPLAAILLCIDVAAASARSANISQQLLNQAQVMLSEVYPGGSPKVGFTYWDQIFEVGLISVTRRLVKCFLHILEQDNPPAMQTVLLGDFTTSTLRLSHWQSQRDRALAMLHQMIEDAHKGKRQFLSGKLHNLARVISDEEKYANLLDGSFSEIKLPFNLDNDVVVGLGLKSVKHSNSSSNVGEVEVPPAGYDMNDSGKKILGPVNSKLPTYLSQFILHIAAIGDIVDGADTTHDFNFFSLIYEWPKDMLIRLVFDQGSTDAAGKIAGILSSNFLHEVISACVPPVVPPKSGQGWACIPVFHVHSSNSPPIKLAFPSLKGLKPNCNSYSSATPESHLYPLKLDIVKNLVKHSPVRAVLACVFGSGILWGGNDLSVSSSYGLQHSADVDRLFYEFALDQSDRFPTLNRWIQMQTNLLRVSEFVISPKYTTNIDKVNSTTKDGIKRMREFYSDTESEVDDIVVAPNAPTNLLDISNLGGVYSDSRHSLKSEIADHDSTVFLSFDWENEKPYEKAAECLINEEKLMDALALSDRFLRNGAPDHLLRLIIEHGAENYLYSRQLNDYRDDSIMGNSWQYCLRLKDKQSAARLSLKHLHRWDLDVAFDILTMCSCHLDQNDPVRNEVLQKRQALQRYNHILCVDDYYNSWQEVEADCTKDPEGLALKLAGKGAVSAALEVAESAKLSIHLRRELQGQQLVKLLTTDPLSGGGPAEASRFLSTIPDSDDVLPVVMGAMQLLPNLRSKQLLVHFFLKRRDGNLSDIEVSRLNSWALGLRVLAALPPPWQQRCSSLHEHPQLILEVLLMRKQLQSASVILKEFPSLRDDDLIIDYAGKAISVSASHPSRGPQISISSSRPMQNTREGIPTRSSFTKSFSKFQREARRAFSWAPRSSGDKTVQQDSYRKRKSSELASSERTQLEALTGIHEDCASSYATVEQTQIPSVSISDEWMLCGDINKDESVRCSHHYESAPDISLFMALLSLCSNEFVSAKGALESCVNQMKMILSYPFLSKDSSIEVVGQAYHAIETFVQGLIYSRSLLRKHCEGRDASINLECCRNSDESSSDDFTSIVQCQTTNVVSEVLSQVEIWLGCAELLQSLLGTGFAVCLDDIADKDSSEGLRDRLILDERYSMAVYTCKKCKIEAFPVWNAWGHALIRMGHYPQARVKFKQALQLFKGYPASVILDIVNTIEGGPPVDISVVRSMYNHLAKSAPTILDDSLSADSYFNVLHMLSTFPGSERSRRPLESASSESASSADFEDGPHNNLDSFRYLECVNYLQEYGRENLLDFMFQHARYNDACMLFFPPNDIPLPPQSSSVPQKPDPLATDYGTIDNLCDLCIGYGSISVLLEVVSTRMSCASQTDILLKQHTAAALDRICTYCETHKHFNYLYMFQVLKRDHVASGLCCIQLYMNSDSQEKAIKHLEHAKMHFEEGLSARNQTMDSIKLISKGIRGKNASEKLSEEGLVKFSARVSIQVDVLKCFNDMAGPQWKYSLFGNPDDPETFRRRCKIAEILTEKNFDLAFQVIYEFNLPAVRIYAGVAASLAERKRNGQLTEFYRNIKGTIDDDDWDQVLGAAINVYADRHKERPDRLIDMLTSSHRKVLACVVCGRLKGAFQIASKSGSVADVQYVAHQALHANALPILDMCKQWLAQCM